MQMNVILILHNNKDIRSLPFNSIKFVYLCSKLNSPEANYKVSTGKKMGRVRSKRKQCINKDKNNKI
jgi:hypothetical protein